MRRGLIPLLAVLAAGCGGGDTSPPPAPTAGGPAPAAPTAATPPAVPAAAKVELTAVTPAELDAAIAAHKGKGVLIDCWFLG